MRTSTKEVRAIAYASYINENRQQQNGNSWKEKCNVKGGKQAKYAAFECCKRKCGIGSGDTKISFDRRFHFC